MLYWRFYPQCPFFVSYEKNRLTNCSAEHALAGDISRAIFPLFLLTEKNAFFSSFFSFDSGIPLMLEALF